MDSTARQREISRELDTYISGKRKKGKLFGWFGKDEGGAVELETHPYVKPYDESTPAHEAPAEAPASQEDASEEAGESADEVSVKGGSDSVVDNAPKKGWFSRWFGSDEVEEPVDDVSDVSEKCEPVDDDLREVARISLSFLRMTDKEALAKIKASPDFEKFKEILQRRQIIK